ncbi:uncharacterized protein LOC124363469 [Homalodisca vitripennis]|uniref:uncharacterized protein LOC124363469 n=1 Tax=Homalodisca vitripennis TaxID=197043 RepID=UPI001EEBAED9|nr:uncharacterized protein LOC124363469 [Homalodisca vitripennis]
MVYTPGVSSASSSAVQVAASLVANLGMMNTGMMIGFPSVLLPPLLETGPGLHTSLSQASWLASISFISAPVACVVAGPMIDRVGRRWGLVLLNLTFIAGWLPSAVFPLSLPALYIGRICSGIGAGAASTAAATYTAEVTTVHLRTAMVLLTSVMISVGAVIIYLWAIIYKESWSEVSWFGFGITAVALVLTVLLPESPLWLLSRGRGEEALQALQRLRGASSPEQVKEELDSFSSRASDKQQTTSWLSSFRYLRKPQVYKPLVIVNMIFLFSNLTGVALIISYAVDFAERAGLKTETYYVAICIAVMRMLSSLITAWVSSVYGRRTPTMISAVIMTVSLAMLTVNVYGLIELPHWLIAVLMLVYVFSGSNSYSTLMWSMLGEVFPTEVRGFASGITGGMGFASCFISVKLYPICVRVFEANTVFLFFTTFGALGIVYIYLYLPETHGKTLLEIEDYFKGPETRRDENTQERHSMHDKNMTKTNRKMCKKEINQISFVETKIEDFNVHGQHMSQLHSNYFSDSYTVHVRLHYYQAIIAVSLCVGRLIQRLKMVLSANTLLVKSITAQVAASLVANWGMLNTGMAMGFPSVVVPPLLGSGPGLHTSFKEASWIASISYISALVSSLLAGPMIDRVGRRWGLMLMNLTFAISWLLLAVFPLSLLAVYSGRVVAGVGIGLTCASVSYTAEIGTVSLRTILVNFNPTLKAIGAFLTYLWACFYQDSWTETSYFGLGLTIIPILLTPLMPESPLWLLSRGRAEEALQALQKLRGASAPEQVKEELDSFSSRASDKLQTNSWLSTFHNLRQPQAYKPLMFMSTYVIVAQLSGVTVVMNYAINFTQKAGLGGEAYYLALVVSSMRLFSSFLSTWACSRWGIRPPALLSSVVMVVSLLMLALSVSSLLTFPPWLVGFLVLLYVLTSNVAYSSIFWAIMGEVFPTSVRGVANGIENSFGYFLCFLAVNLYTRLEHSFSSLQLFLFFAVSGSAGTLLLFLFLPETRGKTLLEIEDYFKGTTESEESSKINTNTDVTQSEIK